jgi:hypothetical protein
LKQVASEYPALTFGSAPKVKGHRWHRPAVGLRVFADYLHYLDPHYARAFKLRERARRMVPRPIARVVDLPILHHTAVLRVMIDALRRVERALPPSPAVRDFIAKQQPDALLVTPLLYMGSTQVDYVRWAKTMGLPSMLCVGSWDHLTTKGLIHEVPDRVTVWNEMQKLEAVQLHGVPADRVVVTGAQAYDHWFTATPQLSRAEFCVRVGLDPDRPFLLYLGSSGFIAPKETPFVLRWLQAIRDSSDVRLRELGVLVRPHPQNAEQWQDVDLRVFGNAAAWPRGGANPVDSESRADYFHSLHYSTAVVGVNTSGLIEAAIVGRPVHTILAPDFAATQSGTLHFSHLVTVNGGLLHTASDIAEHLRQISRLYDESDNAAARARGFVEQFVRPGGIDCPATPRLVAAIEGLCDASAAHAAHQPDDLRGSMTVPGARS